MKNKVLCIGTLVLIAFFIILPHKVQGYEYLPNFNSMKVAEEMDIPPEEMNMGNQYDMEGGDQFED